jgi:hypothetical protein
MVLQAYLVAVLMSAATIVAGATGVVERVGYLCALLVVKSGGAVLASLGLKERVTACEVAISSQLGQLEELCGFMDLAASRGFSNAMAPMHLVVWIVWLLLS